MKQTILLPLLLLSLSMLAQQKEFEGTVVLQDKYPLNNVKIKAKKSKQTVYSDSLGHFSIRVNHRDKLVMKADGFFNEKLRIKKNTPDSINMTFVGTRDAFHAVVKAKHAHADVLHDLITNNEIARKNRLDYRDIYDMIQSQYPKVTISGDKGNEIIYLLSRGPHSILADQRALLVVDGTVVDDIGGISPPQVEQIRVLDGNKAVSYGVRGSCGVIEIDLKNGLK